MNQFSVLKDPPPSKNRAAATEQDEAAGGPQFRKMHIRTGDVVTASLALSVSAAGAVCGASI